MSENIVFCVCMDRLFNDLRKNDPWGTLMRKLMEKNPEDAMKVTNFTFNIMSLDMNEINELNKKIGDNFNDIFVLFLMNFVAKTNIIRKHVGNVIYIHVNGCEHIGKDLDKEKSEKVFDVPIEFL